MITERTMHVLSSFRFCIGFTGLLVIIVGSFMLQIAAGAEDENAKRLSVSEEEVSDEGVVTYDEKTYEVERHNCTFFYDNRYPTNEGGLVNCTWYTGNACCKRTEVTSVFSAMDPLYSASKLCKNYINYLMCFFCSPDQYKFYKSNTKVMVCLDYCESLYDECKTAGFNKTLIGEAYANGTAFCSAQNFDVTENADCFKFDPTVFGDSDRVLSWSLKILLTAASMCLSMSKILS